MLSACAYPAAHLVDAVAAEKEYYAILVVTPGSCSTGYLLLSLGYIVEYSRNVWYYSDNSSVSFSYCLLWSFHPFIYSLSDLAICESNLFLVIDMTVAERSGLRKELCVWSHLESRICWDIKQCANPEDKNRKYGVKINWICDAENGYALKGLLYTGRSGEERQIDQASTKAGQLAQPFVNSNRNVFMDRYFTSYSTVKHLLEHGLTAIDKVFAIAVMF
ncbi:hypothetical protein T03_3679 [Trichinella britovi]|uniref:PiggyBac transposable element-derived protein domain-containing protein n=1 Tax=Trichinella britovi TaxID=45882 RepID=A0A0V1C6H7_TRIBR|nr:hypothetical protein T03_3679 [Trichinella britovi]